MFEIPIVFARIRKGAHHIFIDQTRLPYHLSLHQLDMIALHKSGLIQPEAPIKIPKIRFDYPALAHEYSHQIQNGEFLTESDLAGSRGVSRAWVGTVMSRNK